MAEREIGGIMLQSARLEANGRKYWRAIVSSNWKMLPQAYQTRRQMWDDLEHIAKLIGPEKFQKDCLNH